MVETQQIYLMMLILSTRACGLSFSILYAGIFSVARVPEQLKEDFTLKTCKYNMILVPKSLN